VTAQAAPARGRLGLLHRRDFRLLWTGETTSELGTTISSVALPLVALSVLHAHVVAVTLLSAAAWLPWVVIGLPAGAWVDRLPKRPVMIAADLVSLLAFGSVPVASVLGWLTMTQLVAVALVAGAASVFFATAYRAFIPTMLDAVDLMEGNAKLQGSEQVTHIAGPGLAGLIAQAATPVGGVLANAVSFAVSLGCLSRIDVVEPPAGAERRHLHREIAAGLTVVLHDRLLASYAVFGCLSNFVLTGYQALVVVFLVRTVGVSAGTTGLLLAAGSVGGVAGAMVARRAAARLGNGRVTLWSKVGVAPFGLLLPLTHRGPSLALFIAGTFVVIAGIVAGNIVYAGWLQTYIPVELLGRVSTSVQVVNYGAMPLGAVTAGALASALGVRSALWLMMAGFVAAAGVLLAGPLRRLRTLPLPRQLPADLSG
jgi:MFS family permease